MAVPLQYQSQFIPTDFGAVSNVLGMYRQDMNQREQQFDQAQAGANTALANIYGIETLDPELFQQAGDTLSQKIDEVVSKRGGDYGAAAQDISRLIAQETKNPIYGLNKRKLEQTKLLEHALARNPNLRILKDPRTMGLSPSLSPEDINYSVLDPEEAKRRALELTKHLDTSRIAGIRTDPSGMYNIGVIHKGPTEQQVQELMADPAMAQQLQSYFPQTQGMDSEELTQFFTNTLVDAARSYQREPEERILGLNPYFVEGLKRGSDGSVDTSNLISVSKGRNLNMPKGKPFETLEEVNSLDPSDPRWAIGQQIKESVLQQIPEDDKKVIENYGGIEAVSEISEVAPDLPSPDSYFSKVIEDTGLLLGVLYSGVKSLKGNRIGTAITLDIPSMISFKDKIKKLKEVKPPFTDYVERKANILEKYNLNDFENRTERKSELNKIRRTHNRFKENFENTIASEYNGVLGEFISHDFLTGNAERDKVTEAVFDNLNKSIKSGQIPFESFDFISTNSDIKFDKGHNKLQDNKDYRHISSPGNYRILEAWVDTENLGPMYTIETDDPDGGVSHHVVTIHDPEINARILRAFGTNNIPLQDKKTGQYYTDQEGNYVMIDLMKNYNRFLQKENIKSEFNSKFGNDLSKMPLFNKTWSGGNTIRAYLTELDNSRFVSEKDKEAITNYLMLSGLPLDTQLK